MNIKEYFNQCIERQKTLTEYLRVIDHTEYEHVCDGGECITRKKKIEGIKPSMFKNFKRWVNEQRDSVQGEIKAIHNLVMMGVIQPWEGYNPKEHGDFNITYRGTEPTIGDALNKWWKESDILHKEREEFIKWANEYDNSKTNNDLHM